MPTPTRRKNRHDKDRMIYLSKRKIEKEFHTPRFAKGGQGLWCLVSRGNHRRSNRYDGSSTGKKWHTDFGWQLYPNPSRRSGPTGTLPAAPESVIVGQMLSPYILAGSLLSVAESWNMLEQPMTFLQTDSQLVLSTYFLQQIGADPSVTAIQALLSVFPLLLVFAFAVAKLHNPNSIVSSEENCSRL